MASAACPSCGVSLHIRKTTPAGTRLTCPSCGTRLEVLATAPLELDWSFDGPIQETADAVSGALEDVEDGLAKY